MSKIIGWILIVIFGLNLIYSLFFTMGESFASHIPAIILSIVMLLAGSLILTITRKASLSVMPTSLALKNRMKSWKEHSKLKLTRLPGLCFIPLLAVPSIYQRPVRLLLKS